MSKTFTSSKLIATVERYKEKHGESLTPAEVIRWMLLIIEGKSRLDCPTGDKQEAPVEPKPYSELGIPQDGFLDDETITKLKKKCSRSTANVLETFQNIRLGEYYRKNKKQIEATQIEEAKQRIKDEEERLRAANEPVPLW